MKRAHPLTRVLTGFSSLLVIGLLLLFWGRVLVNVRDQSPVVDEPVHLARAVAYWRTGDLRLQRGHPPLSHALSGLFLVLEPDLPSPADLKGWDNASRTTVAHHLLLKPGRPIERVLFLGRWPVLALGLVLAALVARWASELFGPGGGLAALLLCTFDPNILAHSSLATTDLPVTCLMYAACYAFSRWLDRPAAGRLLLAGLMLGMAWGAKLSALVLVPVLGLVLVWHVRGSVGRPSARCEYSRQAIGLWGWLTRFAAVLGVGVLTLWVVYRFEAGVYSPIGTWVVMPTHWSTLRRLWQHQAGGHRAFFMGQLSSEGWWYYFPVLFLIKTPLSSLVLLVVAAVTAWRMRRRACSHLYPLTRGLPTPCERKRGGTLRVLAAGLGWSPVMIVFPVLYFAVSMASRIDIGYRHILPVVPYVVMGAAAVFSPLLKAPVRGGGLHRFRWRGVALAGLVGWVMLSSLWIHPYYLAYFNALVGGPDQGYRYVVDSNLDWGQDLKRLKGYLDERGIERVKLSYFGSAKPEGYGIEYDPLPMPPPSSPSDFSPFNPEPGVYAISASNLQGVLLEEPDVFDWFRHRQPMDKVGYSIFIYEVTERFEGRWAAVCYGPAPALEGDQIREMLGGSDLRTAYFDCRSSWVYPAGTAPGWYVIPGVTDGPTVVPAYCDDTQVIFHGRRSSEGMGLTIYGGEGAGSESVHWPHPLTLAALEGSDRQPQFGDVARFLGYEIELATSASVDTVDGDDLILRTYWEVLKRPDFPMSVMAHLVLVGEAEALLVGTADGLSFPVENWQEGDVFAQMHFFALPSGLAASVDPSVDTVDGDAAEYIFNVGLYRLDTMERIPPAGFEADHLILGPVGRHK